MWTVWYGAICVRPLLYCIREARPLWQPGLLILLLIGQAVLIGLCWRRDSGFGLNRWLGIGLGGYTAVMALVAEMLSLRPVSSSWIFGVPAAIGAAWVYSEARKGRTAEFSPELMQMIARPKWRYLTPLKFDFWIIWLGMWLPILFGGWLLFREYLSGDYMHRHWSFRLLYCIVLASLVGSTIDLIQGTRKRLVGEGFSVNPLSMLNLSAATLGSAIEQSGLTLRGFWQVGLFLMILEIPREAMERWNKRNAESGRQIYDSLEAPHLGI